MWIFKCLLLFIVIIETDSCWANSWSWDSWSDCSRTCGGGTRTRQQTSCVLHHKRNRQSEGCQEWCRNGVQFSGGRCPCPAWREDPCCDRCVHIYIPHCKSGKQQCGGAPDNIRCTDCYDPYFSAGYGMGCKECRRIDHCQHRHCTAYSNTKCISCVDDNVFFKRREADTKCERLCAWNEHFCWPGTCDESLTKNCRCSLGFKLISDTNETSCQPTKRPSLETCFTNFAGSQGERKQSQSSTSSTECQYYQDIYGNFQVKTIDYDFLTEFTITLPTLPKPAFIKESNFGITDATIYLEKILLSGRNTQAGIHKLVEDKTKSTLARRTYATKGYIPTSSDKISLRNGEWLCARYESRGGGYLKSIDTSKSKHVELQPTPYQKTNTTKSICFRYDDEPPVHCKAVKNCSTDPLFIKNKATRLRTIPVVFKDWFDPSPSSTDPLRASSIESYQITIHETILSTSKVQIDLGDIYKIKVNSTVKSAVLSLPPETPRLYCIELEVKDVAENVRRARRFILYDNTSFIEKSSFHPIYVKSASAKTNYQWQTHHNEICVDWKEHFFNKDYPDESPLNPIEPDHSGIITGVYEQIDGFLPVTGTENVHGIVNFKYTWSLNNNTLSKDIIVPNLLNQSYCKHFDLKDGESYTMKVVATDIANNTCEDNTTVHIDRSVPHIQNIWLQKDNHTRLFVHDRTELSSMSLYFEVIDPHSGILNVNWAFGTTDSGTELLTGVLKPQVVNGLTCPANSTTCYCPDIGYCEIFNYEVPLNGLVSANKNSGNHNRNYYFSIKATNNALLRNIEHVEILVDDSPPEPGAVLEGSAGSPDIDYTSDHVIIANWHGFIDHESGIKVYRVGIARRCLSKDELMKDNGTGEVLASEEVSYSVHTVSLKVNETGKFFVTVIAVNNAIDPSVAVCSDGITRDISPPAIRNMTLRHAGLIESIGCINGTPWFIDASLTKTKLHTTPTCLKRCLNQTDDDLLHVIPQTHIAHNEQDLSDFLCQTLQHFTDRNFIYIPDDYIFMQWTIDDDEGQLDNVFIGFGRDASEQDTPSIIDYTTTNRKTYFKRSHEGIGSKTLFYIFLKAKGKSGLSKVVTVGPVVVDLTPPKHTNIPIINITKDAIKVIWDNDTFYDEEQVSPITHIQFQFATTERVVTPIHEWQLETSIECGRCITYPLHQLQNQDNDNSQEFYVKLFVYNIAGHFSEVESMKFKLPSRYPPGHALVYDVDPDSRGLETFPKDINIHYTPNMLCVKWNGFKHHEDVHIEIGIGLNKAHDNVVKFYTTNKTNEECMNSTKVKFGQTYYVLLRAKCSGGETISSSDGVKVVNMTSLLASLKVGIGETCNHIKHTIMTKYSDGFISVSQPLHIGTEYSVFVFGGNGRAINATYIGLTSNDIGTRNGNNPTVQYIPFVPFVEWPLFQLNISEPTSYINKSSLTIYLSQCGYGNNYITSLEHVSISWYFDTALPLSFSYEIKIRSVSNISNASNSSIASLVSHDHSEPSNIVTFRNLNLNTYDSYFAEVNVCINNKCFGPVFSEEMAITAIPIGTIDDAKFNISPNDSCTEITANWKEFLHDSGMMFYTWSLSMDVETSRLLTDWRVISDTGKASYKVNECLQLPVYVSSTMFICVRGYSNSQSMGQICSKVNFAQYNSIAIDTVYDFDVSTTAWKNIKKVIHSYGFGEEMSLVHNNELNIGTIDTVVAGAMMYATDRTITWFLMTLPLTPVSCTEDDRCIEEISTDAGYVVFPRDILSLNRIYFICVFSKETRVNREFHIEVLPEIKSCSNGFIIDTIAPQPGSVLVKHHDGYITTPDLDIFWEGYTDNIDATVFGFPRNIAYYQIRVGSNPGSDDIVHTRNTSDRTYSFKNLHIKDGATVFVSVTAFDYSNQSTTVSSDEYYVDTSPPSAGDIILSHNIVDQMYSTSNAIGLHLRNFIDRESGIDHFEISIGSSLYNDQVIPTETVLFDTGDIELHVQENNTVDGHRYYISVAAFNRAGLQSRLKTVPIIFDKSPPEAGQVMDGNWMLKNDIDFQTRTDVIEGHWKGFIDQQSGISYYRVGLGTRPNVDDIRSMRFVGLVKDISWRGSFIVGQKYYITVVACNGAGLCRPVSSDGIIVDNSPPIGGLVRVGSESGHQQYITHKTSVRIHWDGFEDPHSGIEKFEVCIGESPFSCDILPFLTCLLQSSIIKSGVDLPLGKYMYATVIAFNKVGMNVTHTSDYFMVDTSAPLRVTKPTFLLDYNANDDDQNVQWEKSVLRVYWEFTDKESPIVRHELSLQTHHDGHSPVEHMSFGNVNKVTINLPASNWLHNGDTYTVNITCCNAAGHCTTDQSSGLLIDSTPPFLGGFKPPMTWENIGNSERNVRSQLGLTWYGFQDEESGIENYYITASKYYSGQELSGGILKIAGNKRNLSNVTERMHLTEALLTDDVVVLAIWAENKAGLNSTIGRISVNVLPATNHGTGILNMKGILEIQKHSCDVHFCNKACTCAILGQACIDISNIKPCRPINDTQTEIRNITYQSLTLGWGLEHSPQSITASSACLAGHWISNSLNFTQKVVRYEWSAGLVNQPTGEGIFDLKSEIPWNDVGLHEYFIYCLPTNRSLSHGDKYVFYVRAWYDFDVYMEYMSVPITVDNTAPTARRGRFVKDSDSSCQEDVDYIDSTGTITGCWDDVFNDPQGQIIYYTVSLGTSPKADDTLVTTHVYMNTSFSLESVNLRHGTSYFFTVTAYNNVGIHTTAVSDGFIVDGDRPKEGVIFNTMFHRNELFQSSQNSLSISWHGFVDHYSGIHSYFVAIAEETEASKPNVTFINIGLQTSYTFSNITLTPGVSYVGIVKAMDAAGHFTTESKTISKTVDISSPQGYECTELELLEELNQTTLHDLDKNFTFALNLTKESLYVVRSSLRTDDMHLTATLALDRFELRLPITSTHDGLRQVEYSFFNKLSTSGEIVLNFNSHSTILGTASINRCTRIVQNESKAVSARQIGPNTIAVSVLVKDEESSIHEVNVGVGSTKGGFQIQTLSPIHGNHGIINVNVPHDTPLYVTAIAENYCGLKSVFHAEPFVVDHTAPEVYDVAIKVDMMNGNHTSVGLTSTVMAEWKIREFESGVKACYCFIGNSKHSTNIVDVWKADILHSCQSRDLDLEQGSTLYVTVRCVNDVELVSETVSKPVYVVHRPPKTDNVHVSFVELNTDVSNPATDYESPISRYMQTNDSHVQIQWSGFPDTFLIDHYEYRLFSNSSSVVEWTSTRYKSMATITGYPFVSGDWYTAEVKAFTNKFASDVVQASILIFKDQPRLSGTPVSINRSSRTLNIDWGEVFQTFESDKLTSLYSLSIGSRPGFNDVKEELLTIEQSLDIEIPESTVVSAELKELFITITCYLSNGMTNIYEANYKI